jgi:predicted dehydrogenase
VKFLIVGLGSMGKRRVRNFTYLKAGTVIGFDPRADRREEAERRYGVRTFSEFLPALGEGPDAVVISTPPDMHLPYMRAAAEAGIPFFCEASTDGEGLQEVAEICAVKKVLAAPSSTMRFNPSVRRIESLARGGKIGRPLALTYHCGQYLPDWHPWEDYRKFYAARRETGACREIVPYELSWLTWVLGGVDEVSAMAGKVSDLDADIDDVYQVLLRFRGGALGHLLVDVVAREAFRSLKLLGSEGVITWEWREHRVRLYDAASRAWREFPEPEPEPEPGYIASDGMYVDEMRHFVAALRGEEAYHYSLEDDLRVLGVLYAAEESSATGTHVRTASPHRQEAIR